VFGVNEVAADELEEKCAVEPARSFEIDILNACRLAQACRTGAHFEPLLPPESGLVFKQQPEPFGVFKTAGLWIIGKLLEALCNAMETEGV
jgi:hypothetical protein